MLCRFEECDLIGIESRGVLGLWDLVLFVIIVSWYVSATICICGFLFDGNVALKMKCPKP